jgi:uncharacterized protein (UPF0212 family)
MATQRLQRAPVPVSIENAADWEQFAGRIASVTGMPTPVTPELLTGMLGSAVALLFEADAAKDPDLLRGTFADPIVAQCARNVGCLEGETPTAAVARLVGVPTAGGRPSLRAHLSIDARTAEGSDVLNSQFWDLQLGGDVTVGQPSCPNCGAPVERGALICGHCGTDVRSVVQVPLLVTRLELY